MKERDNKQKYDMYAGYYQYQPIQRTNKETPNEWQLCARDKAKSINKPQRQCCSIKQKDPRIRKTSLRSSSKPNPPWTPTKTQIIKPSLISPSSPSAHLQLTGCNNRFLMFWNNFFVLGKPWKLDIFSELLSFSLPPCHPGSTTTRPSTNITPKLWNHLLRVVQ